MSINYPLECRAITLHAYGQQYNRDAYFIYTRQYIVMSVIPIAQRCTRVDFMRQRHASE